MTRKELIELVENKTDILLRSKTRKVEYVMARAVYYRLAKELHLGSLASIGHEIGRNHATVLWSINNHWFNMKNDFPSIYKAYLKCKEIINDGITSELEYEELVSLLRVQLHNLEEDNSRLKDQVSYIEKSLGHPVIDDLIHMVRRVDTSNLALLKFRLTSVISGL